MRFGRQYLLGAPVVVLLLIGVCSSSSLGQQVIERGASGKPGQVFDETQQWTRPVLVASDQDVSIYIPDVTSPDWLKRNYSDFENRGFLRIIDVHLL